MTNDDDETIVITPMGKAGLALLDAGANHNLAESLPPGVNRLWWDNSNPDDSSFYLLSKEAWTHISSLLSPQALHRP
jgi:phosphatidate phosphatase APP1